MGVSLPSIACALGHLGHVVDELKYKPDDDGGEADEERERDEYVCPWERAGTAANRHSASRWCLLGFTLALESLHSKVSGVS